MSVSSKRRVSSQHRGKASSNGSSIHLSFSGMREEDAITRSILNDISDHDLMYNSGHTEHRIGISLLPDVDVKREESHSENKLADLCKQLSSELKNTKEELSKLYRENRSLREQLTSQDEEIDRLEHMYETQNAVLFRELQDLRSALKPGTPVPPEERNNVCCLPY